MALVLRRAVLSNNLSLLRCMKGRPLATAFKINTPHTFFSPKKKTLMDLARENYEIVKQRNIETMQHKARTVRRRNSMDQMMQNPLSMPNPCITIPSPCIDFNKGSMVARNSAVASCVLPPLQPSTYNMFEEPAEWKAKQPAPYSCSKYFNPFQNIGEPHQKPHPKVQSFEEWCRMYIQSHPCVKATVKSSVAGLPKVWTNITALNSNTGLETEDTEPVSERMTHFGELETLCSACGCDCSDKSKRLPRPPIPGCGKVKPKCVTTMTGYFYYPYGSWNCGPYNVSGLCVPVEESSKPRKPCRPKSRKHRHRKHRHRKHRHRKHKHRKHKHRKHKHSKQMCRKQKCGKHIYRKNKYRKQKRKHRRARRSRTKGKAPCFPRPSCPTPKRGEPWGPVPSPAKRMPSCCPSPGTFGPAGPVGPCGPYAPPPKKNPCPKTKM